tara:strand:- start:995 stop:1210 length:216 start_codon:yes stop_codon:yes gene_type:complete
MVSQSQKNSEAIQRLDKKVALMEADIKSIKDNHLHTIEHKINILTKVVVALCFMFTLVFADTVRTFVEMLT